MKTVLRGEGEEGGEERWKGEEIKGNKIKGQIFNRRCEGEEIERDKEVTSDGGVKE